MKKMKFSCLKCAVLLLNVNHAHAHFSVSESTLSSLLLSFVALITNSCFTCHEFKRYKKFVAFRD